jgi:GcrA cell cycle regulator
MEQTNWSPEHSDALRKHLAERLTFSAIVKAINLKFRTAYTRNAAIGRAKRMGLAGSDRPQPLLQAKPPRLERIIKPRPVEPGSAALRCAGRRHLWRRRSCRNCVVPRSSRAIFR